MDIEYPDGVRQNAVRRSNNGCWTCRLRRKKCDEKQPVCDTCATLLITCHNDQEKPEWMDGGQRQDKVAEQLKREVKEKAHFRLRRWERQIHVPSDNGSADSRNDVRNTGAETSSVRSQRGPDCALVSNDIRGNMTFGRSDTVLLMFYLENVLPFMFPFYRPSPLEGGKSWILEMMFSSPVVRQATLAQSSYFFSVARPSVRCQAVWDTMLAQTKEGFDILRQSLEVINASNITEHLQGAVRILASIMQVQRFEIAVLSLENCHAHLNAALALFGQLLSSSSFEDAAVVTEPRASFTSVMDRLGPSPWILPIGCAQFPSAEQAAFRFSSALLIFDDIIASTVLQRRPTLYEYHDSLLGATDGAESVVSLEAVVGCHNCVMRLVGEVAVLDAWKQECKRAGNLNMMELVDRATVIKDALDEYLELLTRNPAAVIPGEDSDVLGVFGADYWHQAKSPAGQTTTATRVWIHAALLYLFVVVSGWQTASPDVRHHVARILELLTAEISPAAMLRTMAWPFCVAGCLAEPAQEPLFRQMVEALLPPSVFGTVRKALDIMENVWRHRGAVDSATRDLATCFRNRGELVLLV
jgi:hypothetical protein